INVLIVNVFYVKNVYFCIFFSGITICFPTICSLFCYMFTSFNYTLGMSMAVFGAWLLCRYKHWYTNIIAVILIGSSLGVYQANAGIYVSFILLYMIKDTYENQKNSKKAVKYRNTIIKIQMEFYAIKNFQHPSA
ncbi:MAG: glucosyltransferase domain-containing protein, partial [Clostridia bacterium]|nr:glucosyltransferase domain-containing protein [Clostridia bacterium]